MSTINLNPGERLEIIAPEPAGVSLSKYQNLREAAKNVLNQLAEEEKLGHFKDHTEGWNDAVDGLHAELYG